MMTRPYQILHTLSLIVGFLGIGRAQGKVIDDGPQHLSQISSIGEALRNAGQRPLHILYVHGIGATGAGDSRTFQKGICAFLKGCNVPADAVGRDYADSGEFENGALPPAFEYMGNPVWTSKEEWSASAPFVDHYVLQRSDGGPVVVDEINWWPLVFPLKCRAIMTGEARLAGPDKTLLNLCSRSEEKDPPHPGRFRAYTWISPQEAKALESIRSKGALLNRSLKNGILDWGFSDAMMAAGSMHTLFREGIRQLFLKSVRFHADGSKTNEWQQHFKDPRGVDREFIVVSHSLGSYLVFSTLNMGDQDVGPQNATTQPRSDAETEDAAAQYILERTSLAYFFANQVPLLELANMEGAKAAGLAQAERMAPREVVGALSKRIMKWRELRQNFGKGRFATEESAAKPPQVVSWSDPSDLLSWYVPGMEGLVVVNLYVRNTWWHWLIASPAAAHGNYAKNQKVLRIMLGPSKSQ
jgi:hypothetical protein